MSEIGTEWVTLTVADGTTMPAYVARPSEAPRGGLLVFQEIFGVNAHIRDVTERFARAGYAAIAPALFHRTDPTFESGYDNFDLPRQHAQALTPEGLMADAEAAYHWLTGTGSVTAIGTIGYCLGGSVSFLANAHLPLKAAASYYGNIAGFHNALERTPELHAPMLLCWGGQDKNIPLDSTRKVEDALQAAGKAYTQLTFSQAAHGFFCDVRASFNPDAAQQAWALTLAFFEAHLRGTETK